MAREKKDGKKVSFYFDAELYEQLKAYAEEKGQPITTALERIVRKALSDEQRGSGANYDRMEIL